MERQADKRGNDKTERQAEKYNKTNSKKSVYSFAGLKVTVFPVYTLF